MKTFSYRRLFATLVGLVFLTSGLLKILDPVGTSLIVREYLSLFHLQRLHGAAMVLGILLSLTEACTGAALVMGVARKATATVTAGLVGLFTLLTAFLWISGSRMDCGCFGEALHLTPGQTFAKNLVLVAFSLLAFLPWKDFGTPSKRRQVAFWIMVPAFAFALGYNLRHLPLVDFTVFSPGARIEAAADAPDARDHMVTFIYTRDGQTGAFPLHRLPDSTWTFVRVDTLRRNGLDLPRRFPSLPFRTVAGDYCDAQAAQGAVVVFSVPRPRTVDGQRLQRQVQETRAAGAMPLVLVSEIPETEVFQNEDLPLRLADPKTLLTLNRSNGGATYLRDGEIMAKWSPSDWPADLADVLERDPLDVQTDYIVHRRILAQGFVLYLVAAMVLL